MNLEHRDRPRPSLLEVARLLVGHSALINPNLLPGSILASEGFAWRHEEGQLTEVGFKEYERSVASTNSNEWPPNTVHFEVAPATDSGTLRVQVQVTYDLGLVEGCRGGMEAEVTLVHDGHCWQIGSVDDTMFSD